MEMDCIRSQATISALFDGEPVTDENAQAARAHCDECEQCRKFEANLKALKALRTPKAPAAVIRDVMASVTAIAAERAEEEQAPPAEETSSEAPEQAPPAWRLAWPTTPARWGAYGAVAVGAAAIVLVAVLVARPPAQEATVVGPPSTTGAPVDLTFSDRGAAEASKAPAPTPAPARAPDYVVYSGRAYSPGALLASSAVATPGIGSVLTAFNGSGAPAQVTVYRSPLTDGSIVIIGPDGARIFEPVVRKLASTDYQLVAGANIDRFGLWPRLPGRFAAPTSPDGSPTFTIAGPDALGIQTYSAEGVPQTAGFAVGPGTPEGDPAGSSPNWTWWEPLRTP